MVKKKIDREAMQSAIMRIPRMDVRVSRDLIDIGIREIYELEGRSAESLFDEIKDLKPETPEYRLAYLRMGIYFAENDPPEANKLHPRFGRKSRRFNYHSDLDAGVYASSAKP